jgi:hypothetical protein
MGADDPERPKRRLGLLCRSQELRTRPPPPRRSSTAVGEPPRDLPVRLGFLPVRPVARRKMTPSRRSPLRSDGWHFSIPVRLRRDWPAGPARRALVPASCARREDLGRPSALPLRPIRSSPRCFFSESLFIKSRSVLHTVWFKFKQKWKMNQNPSL